MSYYKPCGPEVEEIKDRMLEKYHGELKEAKVTVDCLFAYPDINKSGFPKGPAIRRRGFAAAGLIRIVGLRDRTAGMGDAQMLLDGKHWDKLSDAQKDALVDHELTHLELKRGKKSGLVKTDDLGRPELRMRNHDREYGWFDSVARRHGPASLEVQQATEFFEKNRQTYMPFMEPEAAAA